MSERQAKRARRTTGGKSSPPQLNGDSPGGQGQPEAVQEPQPMSHPAVVVMRVPAGEPGQERVEMMEINGLDPLSVPTLLRLAARIKEEALGSSERK